MAREFLLPDLGEGITEAQIIRVLIKDGDDIAEDQYLMEVETDKAAVEIPSPYRGVAQKVHVQEGQTINVGDVIVTFDDGDGATAPPKATAAVAAASGGGTATAAKAAVAEKQAPPANVGGGNATVSAAPVVRKLAREMGIDLATVQGSGPGGRIVKADLETHASGGSIEAAAPSARAPSPPKRVGQPAAPIAPIPEGKHDTDNWGSIRRVPLSQIRKTIARQMSKSAHTIPHVTHCDEADITELDRMRRELNEVTGGDPKLTAMTFMVRALCIALRKYPMFNASFDEESQEIIYKEYVSMGIAVDTERGLIVPVLPHADHLSLRGIGISLRAIADKIRANDFTIDELRGGTFTITNVGALGGTFTTPIINHPEVAILGLGRSRKSAVIKNGEVVEALTLPLSLSFDHRATDGANAARFTREVISYLETPAKFLLD